MYQSIINDLAQRQLDRLSFSEAKRIISRIFDLRANPRPVSCKKLHNENGYRIRIGDYRVLYEVDDIRKKVTIYQIAHRKDAYR